VKQPAHEMGLPEVEDEIESTYRWWHQEKPGVTPKEVNRLGDLWRRCDYLLWKEG
jgi:hypothetical protein